MGSPLAGRGPIRSRGGAELGLRPDIPAELEGLVELALDLRWTWTHEADELWGPLDLESWSLSRNPWLVLQTVSARRLQELAGDAEFRELLAREVSARQAMLSGPGWFQRAHPGAPLSSVAYFSLEFGLSEALPIYSGGLGILAGDHLKAASDLGIPLVGVGLLYQQGYFRQVLDPTGRQVELRPFNDPSQLPVTPLRDRDGAWLRIPFQVPGRAVWVRGWEARVGRVPLYLLDSNDPLNTPADRSITAELYGGGPEVRIQQELLLGIAGYRLLEILGVQPEVCHLNEGGAAFTVLARAHAQMEAAGQSFAAALTASRPGNLFTTHTPVAAGFDRFERRQMEPYLAGLASWLGVDPEAVWRLGQADAGSSGELFNTAHLAVRGCGAVNGVSRLHGAVSRRIFQPLFPRWPEREVPVSYVTNGVHLPSWESAEMDALLCEACGRERWFGEMEEVEGQLRDVSDEALWEHRGRVRRALIEFARIRLARQRAAAGCSEAEVAEAHRVFDPNALTLVFARRFAAYKRPDLLLHEGERLIRLCRNPQRPVQIIVAGKAHPRDDAGKELIRAWSAFARRPEIERQAVLLADYDLLLAERLVQGADVWLNTPRRPWEASGTSGMKVLVNGGLNLSELDGWWAEAYRPDVGWALGDGREHDHDPSWDRQEARELLRLLEEEVVPCFYDRDAQGIPRRWLARMRESMARLTPRFSTNRMVREYTEERYLPGALAWRRRTADGAKLGQEIEAWRETLAQHWGAIHVLNVQTLADGPGATELRAHVYLGEVPPEAVRVEAFADPVAGRPDGREEMVRRTRLAGAAGAFLYQTRLPADRPSGDFTVRVVPHHPEAAVPLEAAQILWEH